MNLQQNNIQEDEIDLRELFLTLWSKRVFIVAFTLLVTIVGTIYAYIKTPIYEAKAFIEVGTFNSNSNSNSNSNFIENPQNLIKKLLITNKDNMKTVQNATIQNISLVKSTPNLIEIVVLSTSNTKAENFIKIIIEQIENEHNDKIESFKALIISNINNLKSQVKLLEKSENKFEGSLATKFELTSKINDLELQISPHNIQKTEMVGKIITNDKPIKPKKKLIISVSFVTGFILSIFLVFFMQFIKSFKEEEK